MAGVAGRSGRKAFVPNPDQRHIVRTLTRLGIPQKHICRVVTNPQTGKPLDAKSLRKHFALEIRTGAAELHFLVGRFILATILGLPPPPGTVAITDERARAKLLILFAEARWGGRKPAGMSIAPSLRVRCFIVSEVAVEALLSWLPAGARSYD